MLVELKDAVFGYGGVAIVEVGALSVRAGVCLGIFGPNGSGKTTMVRGITGLLPPMRGAVRRITSARFGYLPQHRAMELHWPMSGLDAASMAVSARGRMGWVSEARPRVVSAMKRMGVEDLASARFARLSGGQQQRLLLAGALAAEPNVLVLDEPTDGLDVHSRQALLETLREQTCLGLATVIITHDMEDLIYLADEVAWLRPGEEANEASRIEVVAATELAWRMAKARSVS